ncbi:MAG: TetR/AcrR family transcriptional regulator [Candidatus Gastranaerophilaceae bacterium]|jgi:AcrR family transcriptional regulator
MARPKKQLNRREDIIEAAQILFVEKGFEKTSVDEIAKCIGISKGSIYLDFKNKNEIYVAIVEQRAIELLEQVEENIKAAKAPYLNALGYFLKTHPLTVFDRTICQLSSCIALIHTSYEIKKKLKHVIQRVHNAVGFLLEKAAKNGEIQQFDDYNNLAHLLHISFHGFYPPYDLKYSIEHKTDLSKEEIRALLAEDVSFMTEIILSGLKSIKKCNQTSVCQS